LVKSISKKWKIHTKRKIGKFRVFEFENIDFFRKKNAKSGLRGGAEFGTHGLKNFWKFDILKKYKYH
jgi:hypothetical protein